jgi:pyruvate/2-oxoglutarate dehydrogenase complex dihydrolipoamide acyltransferase (E2) component
MLPVRVPHEQVNDETVLLVEWLAADGGEVEAGQVIAIIETSKSTAQVESPQAGFLRQVFAKGTEVAVGAVFCYIAASPTDRIPVETQTAPAKEVTSTDHVVPRGSGTVPALADSTAAIPGAAPARVPESTRFSRRALALLEKHGASTTQFHGKGLIREADVLALIAPDQTGTISAAGPSQASPRRVSNGMSPASANGTTYRAENLPRMKRVEAKYLAWSQQNTLTSVVSVLCPTSGLKAAAALHPELGGTATCLIVFEAARLLRKYPMLNAFHAQGKIHFYEAVNIGLAVDAGRGLKVPVICDADKKAVRDIARELEDLVLGYMSDELPVTALADGTFTVTDLSGEGVFLFHPLINQNQAAILGVGAEFFPPGASQGFFNLILSFDHQLTEGRTAAKFLNDLRERISSYEMVLCSSRKPQELSCARCLRTSSELADLQAPLLEEVLASGERALICGVCLKGW